MSHILRTSTEYNRDPVKNFVNIGKVTAHHIQKWYTSARRSYWSRNWTTFITDKCGPARSPATPPPPSTCGNSSVSQSRIVNGNDAAPVSLLERHHQRSCTMALYGDFPKEKP